MDPHRHSPSPFTEDGNIEELEARLESFSDPSANSQARIDALLALAWAIQRQESARANALAGEARALSIDIGYKLGQARAARILGMSRGEYTSSLHEHLAYAEEAKQLFDEVGDLEGRAASRDFLASIADFLGDLSTGMELAQEAVTIARELGNPVRVAYALCNVGEILAQTGNTPGGIERLREALELFESVGHSRGIGRICAPLSKLCREAGFTEEALELARRGLEVSMQSGHSDERAHALAALAELERDKGSHQEAERLFQESLATYDEVESRTLMGASAALSLARLMAERGALDEAQAELEQTLDLLVKLSVSPHTEHASLHQALADVSERQGNLPKAIQHLRDVVRLRDQAAERETLERLARFEARAELKAAQQEAEIHRLKYVELTKMQSKLVAAEKMAQLGTLAAGTAHELNSPLGVLRSNLNLHERVMERLSELGSDDPTSRDRTAKLSAALIAAKRTSEEAIERIASVAESFRRFTQLDLSEKRVFNVVEGLRAAIALLRPNVPERVAIETQFDDVPDIEGWPGQLNQAFMTVLVNASQAIDGAGSVVVETSSSAGRVQVRIRDTGRGMQEEERARLFDVGWSADGTRTKMRMGLSAAHATVQRHGGTVEVESAPGEGTTFEFCFPTRDAPSKASGARLGGSDESGPSESST